MRDILGIFLDIETNGLDPFQHDPLEIAFIIQNLTTGKRYVSYQAKIICSEKAWSNRDPNSILVNGFSMDDFVLAKSLENVGAEIISIFDEAKIQRGASVFICQNPSFDRPFFSKIISPYTQEQKKWPYHWLDLASMYWARYLAHDANFHAKGMLALSKDSIAKRFNLSEEPYPHKAMNGVTHLIECYEKVVGYVEKE
ncbi:MAG: 3'-5' exonuclease [Chlamydia sp.]